MDSSKYLKYTKLDFEWAMKLNRISLQLLGLWPKVENSFREKLMSRLHVLVILLLLVFGIFIPYTLSLLTVHSDVILIIQNLQFISIVVSCIVKLIIFWWKKKALTPIVDMIASDWQNTRNLDEREVMIKWAQRARTVIIIVNSIMGTVCACFLILPAFGIQIAAMANTTISGKLLPLQPYDIYDATNRPLYELTYFAHILSVVSASVTYSGIDTFLGFLVFHICGQLDILGTRIMKLDRLMKYHDYMKKCVIDHIRLLRAIDAVEDIYNMMLLVIFLNSAILFAVYGFVIVIMMQETNNVSMRQLVFFMCNTVNVFAHISLYCAVGEMLVTKCERLHYAVYDQKWYLLNTKRARELILMMLRSEEPCHITAGKIFPLTMVTLCTLIKTSAGYISVLLTTRK